MEALFKPWPWYIAGPLIGLTVPLLFLIGNKTFGISSSLRHICAACLPGNVQFFKYDWKKEIWNLVFAGGILVGAFLAVVLLSSGEPVEIHHELSKELSGYGITDHNSLMPRQLFSWDAVFSARTLILMVGGGFLIGFGTRYAGGCTSGHAISGISNLQWPSVVATICFMIGGFIAANFILPVILSL